MPKKTQKTLVKGVFLKYSTGLLHVTGTVDGVNHKDVATGLENTKANVKYCVRHKEAIIREKTGLKKVEMTTLVEYGFAVLSRGTKVTDSLGRVGKKGRNAKNQKDIMGKFEKHIKAYFKNVSLDAVTTGMVNAWQKEKLETLSPSTVSKLRFSLNKIFHEAIGDELITRNPVEYAESIENYNEKGKVYSPKEVSAIVGAADGFFKVYLNLMLVGLRPSEIHGLMPIDFDLDRGVLYLERSLNDGGLVATNEKDPALKFLVESFGKEAVNVYRESTKNHKRFIVLSSALTLLVEQHMDNMGTSQNFMFVTKKTKNPYSGTKSIIKYSLKSLLKKLNIEYKGLYAFRHSMATINIAIGNQGLQQQMGHSEGSSVTVNSYDHGLVTDKMVAEGRAAAERAEALLSGEIKVIERSKNIYGIPRDFFNSLSIDAQEEIRVKFNERREQ